MEPILRNAWDKAGLTKKSILPYETCRPFADLPAAPLSCEKTVAKAVELLDKPISVLPASLYRQYYENGNRSNYETPCFQRRMNLLVLALAEVTENKGRFLDLLIDYIWAICEETSWVIPAHNTPRHGKTERLPDAFELGDGDDIHYIDLFSASTGACLATVWYLLHDKLDALTPVVSRRMLGLLEQRILRPFRNWQDSMWWKGTKGNTLNNWTPWIVSNVLTVLLFCEKDQTKRETVVDESIVILDRFIGFYMPDGGCDEGPGYWSVAGASYFDCLELLYDLTGGKLDIFNHPLVRRMGEYIADFHITDNLYVNFADAAHKIGSAPWSISRFGRRCHSDKLCAFASALYEENPGRSPGDGFRSVPYRTLRNLIEPIPTPVENPTVENTVFYPNLEVFLTRDADSGLFLAAKGGHNAESHNHNDLGNFLVFRGNHPIFIDGGVEQYTKKTFSAERYTLWTMRSRYHNLPDIGEETDTVSEQLPGKQYHAALVEQTENGVCFDLTKAWSAEAGILCYTRASTLVGNAVTVTDKLTLQTEKPVTWHFLCAEKPVVAGNTLTFPIAGCGAVVEGGCFALSLDEVPLENKLRNEWQTDVLWRVNVRADKWTDGEMKLTVLAN